MCKDPAKATQLADRIAGFSARRGPIRLNAARDGSAYSDKGATQQWAT